MYKDGRVEFAQKMQKKTELIRFYKDGVHEAHGREVVQKLDCEKEDMQK